MANLITYALPSVHEVNNNEPRTYKEVVNSKGKLKWLKAMDKEIESLIKNKTWKLKVKLEIRKIV